MLEKQPDRVDALTNLGGALTEMERYDEALAVLTAGPRTGARELKVLGTLAVPLYRRMDADELTAVGRTYCDLSPDNVDILTMLAGGLTWLGKLDEAREVCQAGLAVQPDKVFRFKHQLNEMKLDGADRDAVAQFRADLDNAALPMIERLVAGFSLGTALQRLADYDAAFAAFATANALVREPTMRHWFRHGFGRKKPSMTYAAFTRPPCSSGRAPGATSWKYRSSSLGCRDPAQRSSSRSPPATRVSSPRGFEPLLPP